MLIGVNQIVVGCLHAVKRHWPPEIHHVDERMGRIHHPGQHLKVCLRVGEVADTAIGDHTQAAEPIVNIGVHFAPEGTIARSIIKVFDENDRRLRAAFLDVPVIVDHVGRLTRLVLRPNTRSARITYDRRERGPCAEKGSDVVAMAATRWFYHLKGITNGRRIECSECIK